MGKTLPQKGTHTGTHIPQHTTRIALNRGFGFHLETGILTKYVNIYDGDKLILRDKIWEENVNTIKQENKLCRLQKIYQPNLVCCCDWIGIIL